MLTVRALATDVVNVAWALSSDKWLDPLVILSYLGLVFIYDVKKHQIVSQLRGHGAPITSVAVHPKLPHLFCTTSRDFSTRVYDLTLKPKQRPSNPHWPPNKQPSLAGPAHGLDMSQAEGPADGIGRCVLVLMGGRSGGHQGEVLGADFHPRQPLLATCGASPRSLVMDRFIKIWHLPPQLVRHKTSKNSVPLLRQDKPLFSSSRLHKSRVISVSWLEDDMLISHCAPAMMRVYPAAIGNKTTYNEPGTIVLWRWLSLNRFFPATKPPDQEVLRGCASDYQQSASFKILSVYSITECLELYNPPRLSIFRSEKHSPFVLFTRPKSNTITMYNVSHFDPRNVPPYTWDEDEVAELTERMQLTDEDVIARRVKEQPPGPEGWEVMLQECNRTVPGVVNDMKETLVSCSMGFGGRVIVGTGSLGSIWIWRRNHF
ncbi:WD40 repeat-like protein [Guyanagaster necrorhizus]|uniref:WD40 repeat-like protein n=1 Tax=Guyanagaster necrorhizus TaxID=856835 RepID=A0A9P8AWH0_9AGAR|nr:WD40 repeat-like protein [Guyanagaster necrorhizus MCA 3950]KAG7450573.1 WD40 repeat-like protein [Guyanagaster necrorhizus MCA 3950]